MKVQELIAALMEMPGDAEVMVYSRLDEGADWAHDILLSQLGDWQDENRPYIKADWVDRGFTKDSVAKRYTNTNHVVIIK